MSIGKFNRWDKIEIKHQKDGLFEGFYLDTVSDDRLCIIKESERFVSHILIRDVKFIRVKTNRLKKNGKDLKLFDPNERFPFFKIDAYYVCQDVYFHGDVAPHLNFDVPPLEVVFKNCIFNGELSLAFEHPVRFEDCEFKRVVLNHIFPRLIINGCIVKQDIRSEVNLSH